MEQKKIIGQKLMLLRKSSNMTQKELGDKIGVSARYVSMWESGQSWIPLRYLIEVADILAVDMNYFSPKEGEGSTKKIKDEKNKLLEMEERLSKLELTVMELIANK